MKHTNWKARWQAAGHPFRKQESEGQSLVEVALVLPILLLLLVFVVDLARVFDAQIVLANAVREGARFGSLADPLTLEEIQNIVYEDVVGSGTNVTRMPGFEASDVEVLDSTDTITVRVTFPFRLWFGGLIGVDSWNISAEAHMPRRGDL